MKFYFLLKHAIKFADIELLRYVIRNCMIIFQIKVDDVSQYDRELIKLVHLIDNNVASFELQRVVFINEFVNLYRRLDYNFETDRLLKLLNNVLKYFQRERFFYVYNNDKLFTS